MLRLAGQRWFGGKRKVAPLIWQALGPVDNYIEPFAGSLATLLARPDDRWQTGAETVNDKDAYLANFWRALQHDPEQVAQWCDWPVNETDLFARHLWLVNTGRERIASMQADPDFYDAKVAGYWGWGVNAWIGSGWCSGMGPWRLVDGKVVNGGDGSGVKRQLPHLSGAGQGVNRKRPALGGEGHQTSKLNPSGLYDYFEALAARLRRVRVCCGDWSRIMTDGAMAYGSTVGVFLDPPYSGEVRDKNLYATDDHDIAVEVRDWAVAHGDDRRLRIVLCGYVAEHDGQMPATWRRHRYSASASNQTAASAKKARGNAVNRHNECIWFSPGCLNLEPGLWDAPNPP